MHRCLHLAELGRGHVAPNPMVGAVLVHDGQIIGEGYHEKYGEAHAEVNCINSVGGKHKHLIASSTLYISLEPCAHFGKTPPCADLIVAHNIPKVVIGCRDIFAAVNGKGITILKEAGIDVTEGICENKCLELNRRFFTFHQKKRPYIILKWAQSVDGSIATELKESVAISGDIVNRLVHRWRSEETAIMVGTNTALADDPRLNTRLWNGDNPVRIVLDKDLRLPGHLNIFDRSSKTIVFNTIKSEEEDRIIFYKLSEMLPGAVMNACYELDLQSVIIEGGTKLLQSFIDDGLFDEIRVIINTVLTIPGGYPAPKIKNATLKKQEWHSTNVIQEYSLL